MTENCKRLSTCVEEGRINNFPEHLVYSILERLPIEDAARTSNLSKKWRYLWTTMEALVFDEQFSDKFSENGAFGRNGFIRIINQVLFLHRGPISKFYLWIPCLSLDIFQEVDQWMSFLSRNGVTELVLRNKSRGYKLPSYVFSCLELRRLELWNCIFKPPLEFEGFLSLEDLKLEYIDFRPSSCGTLINLPELKILSLHTCTNVYSFNIRAKNLQKLIVINCRGVMLLRLLESPCLNAVGILSPIGDSVQVQKMNLPKMLSSLPEIVSFKISGHILKTLSAEKIPKWLPHTVDTLKRLWLVNFQLCDLDQLHGALCFLRNSPNLEVLTILQNQMDPDEVGSTSNHLETQVSLDVTMNRLRTVEITCLEGSMAELLFIKLILAHSPSLEKLTIRPSRSSGAQKRLNVAMDVMRFPRASPKAEMIYMDLPHYPGRMSMYVFD